MFPSMETIKCPDCQYVHQKLISVSLHYRRIHKKTSKQLYIDLKLNGISPVCKCGCGEEPKFLSIEEGFREYKRGHVARVHNNWGHNPTALEKSKATKIQIYGNSFGPSAGWCKGLTKETSESLRVSGEKTKLRMAEPEVKKFYSEAMRKNRLNGTIPTQYGENHSQWQGGTSTVRGRCHANTKFFKDWKYPILIRDGFKCIRCSNTKGLHVHHDKEFMASIVKKHISEFNPLKKELSFEEETEIMEKVVNYHINAPVSGVTLCEICHKEEHTHLNF